MVYTYFEKLFSVSLECDGRCFIIRVFLFLYFYLNYCCVCCDTWCQKRSRFVSVNVGEEIPAECSMKAIQRLPLLFLAYSWQQSVLTSTHSELIYLNLSAASRSYSLSSVDPVRHTSLNACVQSTSDALNTRNKLASTGLHTWIVFISAMSITEILLRQFLYLLQEIRVLVFFGGTILCISRIYFNMKIKCLKANFKDSWLVFLKGKFRSSLR
jgi:hypothetical protein